MRDLNIIERQLIEKVSATDTFNFRDLFSEDFLKNVQLALFHDRDDVKIFYSKEGKDISKIFKELITVLGTIRLLEKYDLLLKVQIEFPIEPVTTFGDLTDRGDSVTKLPFGDKSIKLEILANKNATYYVTEELKVLVKNKFKTKEQIRHKQTLRVAWVAIGITLIFSAISTSKDYISSKKENRSQNLKLIELKARVDSLEKTLTSIEKRDTITN